MFFALLSEEMSGQTSRCLCLSGSEQTRNQSTLAVTIVVAVLLAISPLPSEGSVEIEHIGGTMAPGEIVTLAITTTSGFDANEIYIEDLSDGDFGGTAALGTFHTGWLNIDHYTGPDGGFGSGHLCYLYGNKDSGTYIAGPATLYTWTYEIPASANGCPNFKVTNNVNYQGYVKNTNGDLVVPSPLCSDSSNPNTGGPYQICPGETILLDGSASSATFEIVSFLWHIAGEYVGDQEVQSVSYNHLVNVLGLSPGVHDVELATLAYSFDCGCYTWTKDWTTIQVFAQTAGDFQPDGDVDFYDFAILARAWLTGPGDGDWNPVCDISDPNDNLINELDLAVLRDSWLATCE